MHSTDQYRVFPSVPADRVLSRPRRLLSEGRLRDAADAYRAVLTAEPELRTAWLEYFSLLRQEGRHGDALELAAAAASQFGDDALPFALRGAALVELGRFRDGLEALDEAAQRDPDLGLIWHEAGYAAWRLGELSRALMALDRAFALEPHSGTLHLRGKVLRQAGRYLAAEVAFEGAAEAAEFPVQREAAARELAITRRFALFPGTRPETLTPAQRWFADQGAVALSGSQAPAADAAAVAGGFARLAGELGWRFTVLVALDAWPGWYDLAGLLGVAVAADVPDDPAAVPLVASRRADHERWADTAEVPLRRGRGASLLLAQDPARAPADLAGWIGDAPTGALDLALASTLAGHPGSRLAGRVLGLTP